MFPATSNKREIADKQKIDDANNSNLKHGQIRSKLGVSAQ